MGTLGRQGERPVHREGEISSDRYNVASKGCFPAEETQIKGNICAKTENREPGREVCTTKQHLYDRNLIFGDAGLICGPFVGSIKVWHLSPCRLGIHWILMLLCETVDPVLSCFWRQKIRGHVFIFIFLAKQECWADSIRTCKENDIFSAHTHLLLLAKTRLAHTFSFFPQSLSLSFCFFSLIQSLCHSSQHNASYIPILSLPRLHICTRTLSHTPNSLPRVP